MAGPAYLEETVTVIVQEYEGETPLQSTIYENGEEKLVDNIQITDKLSTLYKQTSQDPIQPPFPTVKTLDGDIVQLGAITKGHAQVLNLYNTIYPNRQEHYAYGQYAEYQDFVISKLNTRTTKVRVTLRFDIVTERMNEIYPDATSNDLFDLELWRKPYAKIVFKEFRNSVLQIFNQNESSQYKDRPLNEQIRPGNASHAMVTSLGLILEPIIPTTQDISGFKRGLIEVIPKELEQRPTPIDVYNTKITFQEVASNISGLQSILDIQGRVDVHFYTQFDAARWWQGQIDGADNPKDDKDYSGRITITDLTTGQVLLDNGYGFGDGIADSGKQSLDFKGMHTIRIKVHADSGDSKKKVHVWLSIYLANEGYEVDGSVGPGRIMDVWPPGGQLTYNPQSINVFENNRMGKNPRKNRGENVKNFQIDIPSNQIAMIFGGTRWWQDGDETSDTTVSAKMEFGPTGLVYFRV